MEWDQIYNDVDFAFGDATTDPGQIMDLQNIATHEFGHAIGLADITDPSCSFVTMFFSASYRETRKRDITIPGILLFFFPCKGKKTKTNVFVN